MHSCHVTLLSTHQSTVDPQPLSDYEQRRQHTHSEQDMRDIQDGTVNPEHPRDGGIGKDRSAGGEGRRKKEVRPTPVWDGDGYVECGGGEFGRYDLRAATSLADALLSPEHTPKASVRTLAGESFSPHTLSRPFSDLDIVTGEDSDADAAFALFSLSLDTWKDSRAEVILRLIEPASSATINVAVTECGW